MEVRDVNNQTLTVKDVAMIMKTSTATVYNMVRDGQIPCVRVRSSIRFNRKIIESWLQGKAE